jgi:hypothetical protein
MTAAIGQPVVEVRPPSSQEGGPTVSVRSFEVASGDQVEVEVRPPSSEEGGPTLRFELVV